MLLNFPVYGYCLLFVAFVNITIYGLQQSDMPRQRFYIGVVALEV
jgi:hypothetical protein